MLGAGTTGQGHRSCRVRGCRHRASGSAEACGGGARRNVAAAHTFAAANPLLACFLGDGVSAALARSPDGTGGGVGTTTLGRLELLGLAPSAGRLVDLPLDGVFDVEVPWNAVTERGALPLFKGGHFLRSGREPAVPVVEVGLSLRVAAAAA